MKRTKYFNAQISESKFTLHYETSLPVSIKKNNKREYYLRINFGFKSQQSYNVSIAQLKHYICEFHKIQ